MKKGFRAGMVLLTALCSLVVAACATSTRPQPENCSRSRETATILTRLVFQDHRSASLKWADVWLSDSGKLSLDTVNEVAGFNKLDPRKQKLVQMRECNGLVLVGVRDNENGSFASGWVLLNTGVGYVDHGGHGHWRYKQKPEVWDSKLDSNQGNPAHLYLYDGCFYLANDRLNGYTRLDPGKYVTNEGRKLGKDTPRFLVGGGNHITLAVVEGKVGYSCWIDADGPNKGKVDVTPITSKARSEPAYSFRLPSGGIHGAIACSGKVFFAPADGICWVEADVNARLRPADVKVHHLSLGKDGDRPRRTGAFASLGRYVLFVTGREDTSALVLLDAREAHPKPISVPLKVKKGTRALTPEVVLTPEGKPYAFIFHDHDRDVDAEDALEIVSLDPDNDGDYRDARIVKTLKVGKSAVEGHFGHHDLAFDADGRYAFFTNPGDGTISALSLKTLEIVVSFEVGGMPTALLARGGRETDD